MLNLWIREVEFVKWNSWSWIRNFVTLNSWIREVEFVKLNSWSWNREFVKLKPWINEAEMSLPVFRSYLFLCLCFLHCLPLCEPSFFLWLFCSGGGSGIVCGQSLLAASGRWGRYGSALISPPPPPPAPPRLPNAASNDVFITKTCLFKYTEIFTFKKLKIFRKKKNSDIFHISAQNIDCGFSLEPLRRGGSNDYPQSVFFYSRNKKNNVYPCKPQFYYIKVGLRGSKLYRRVFMMIVLLFV